jgi:hypothetical protein
MNADLVGDLSPARGIDLATRLAPIGLAPAPASAPIAPT